MDAYRPSTADDGISQAGRRISHPESHRQGIGGAQETGNHFRRRAGSRACPNIKGKKAELEYNSALFALLRQKRKEMADEAGVPPYVIFSDKTLVEMAAYYPQSVASLLNISGVGQVKLRQYGEAFLDVIKTLL